MEGIQAEENMTVPSQLTGAEVLLVLLLMNACAQPPAFQLEAAQKAVDEAKLAGAEIYAKDDFMKLEQEFALAKDELAKQETVFSIFRLYDDVDEMLSTVVEYGGRVAAKASKNKEVAKTAALAMEQDALWAVVSAKRLTTSTLRRTERDTQEVIKQQLTALEAGVAEVHGLIENGDYLTAEMHAKTLKENGVAVSGALSKRLEGESPGPMYNDYRDLLRN